VHQDSASLAHSIRLVDEDFVEAASADSAAIDAFVSPETRFLRDGATAGVGFDALAHAYTARERTARWAMASQGVARTGDLGFAYGTWSTPETDDAHSGAWLRIWRRDPAGDWKLALDAVSGSRSAPFP
jgi:ketosteroid isomerase-like protein